MELNIPLTTLQEANSSTLTSVLDKLEKITALLEVQTHQLASQDVKITELTRELDAINAKIDDLSESTRKDEVIRKLELELEQARS